MFTESEALGRRLIEALLKTQDTLCAYLASELASYELDLLSYRLLCSLAEEGAASVTELAERLGFSVSQRTNALRVLEEKHLVQRTANPADRRSTLVGLSERGATLFGSTRHLHRSLADVLTDSSDFSYYDLRDLIRLTEKLSSLLEGQ